MDSRWLSNAYLVADEAGGTAVFVDSGAPLEPLLRAAEEWRVTPTHVLRTHAHPDHVEHESELGLPVVRHSLETGGLWVDAIPTPGHSDDMVCFVINDHAVFSGDTLFKDAVGGGDFEQIKEAVMDVYMPMPHDRRVLPGHTDETTIGREWEQNPFVRVWRGSRARGDRAGARCGPRRDARRLVTRLRRQGQGLGALRRRRRRDRRRLTGGARLVDIVDPRIEAYTERVSSPHDPLLAELSAATTRELGQTAMLTGPVAGRFLELLVWIAQPRRVLEIGTFSGHSALAMAAALPEGGHIDACEVRPGARRLRPGVVRPLAARLEDHAACRAGGRDDRVARRRVRLRLHRRRQGRLHRTTKRWCRGSHDMA